MKKQGKISIVLATLTGMTLSISQGFAESSSGGISPSHAEACKTVVRCHDALYNARECSLGGMDYKKLWESSSSALLLGSHYVYHPSSEGFISKKAGESGAAPILKNGVPLCQCFVSTRNDAEFYEGLSSIAGGLGDLVRPLLGGTVGVGVTAALFKGEKVSVSESVKALQDLFKSQEGCPRQDLEKLDAASKAAHESRLAIKQAIDQRDFAKATELSEIHHMKYQLADASGKPVVPNDGKCRFMREIPRSPSEQLKLAKENPALLREFFKEHRLVDPKTGTEITEMNRFKSTQNAEWVSRTTAEQAKFAQEMELIKTKLSAGQNPGRFEKWSEKVNGAGPLVVAAVLAEFLYENRKSNWGGSYYEVKLDGHARVSHCGENATKYSTADAVKRGQTALEQAEAPTEASVRSGSSK